MTTPGLGGDLPARLAPACPRAVLLAAVAEPANRPDPLAERTDEHPLIGHALARADLLALALASGEGATVDAPSRDTEGRELALLAFVLSALADVS